jgi:prepilin-type N-terminal cleavage/methylation domain-containing protein
MRLARRSGFTLIELLAALSISGLAMIGGILVLDQITDSTARIVRAGVIAAREGNGPRVLRQLLLDARVTPDSLDRFRGDERSLEFSTLCQRPGGWLEPCRASVGIDWRNDTSVVMAMLSTGENLELARRPGVAELRYFDGVAGDSAWLQRWALSIAMPIAIGIVTRVDTVIYPMGTARD